MSRRGCFRSLRPQGPYSALGHSSSSLHAHACVLTYASAPLFSNDILFPCFEIPNVHSSQVPADLVHILGKVVYVQARSTTWYEGEGPFLDPSSWLGRSRQAKATRGPPGHQPKDPGGESAGVLAPPCSERLLFLSHAAGSGSQASPERAIEQQDAVLSHLLGGWVGGVVSTSVNGTETLGWTPSLPSPSSYKKC